MPGDGYSSTAKPCDSCKTAPSAVFCRADAAFLCSTCDAKIHAANKLASRHARVLLCEVCEQAPAAVTCKADAAALCAACDRDIHSANPLARRHDRVPIVVSGEEEQFSDEDAEAASWLIADPNCKLDEESESRSAEYLFSDVVDRSYHLDLDLMSGNQKQNHGVVDEDLKKKKQQEYCSDGVVPVQNPYPGPVVVDGYPSYYDPVDYGVGSTKPFMYNFTSQSISQSVSSSSMDVGVVPDHNAMTEVTKNEAIPTPLSGIEREARVSRYREKRRNRKFEKTIRYASRKAYAETRPRIKGRFAKRSESDSFVISDASYGVVPSF